MLKSSLCKYSDPYILVIGIVTVLNTAVVAVATNNAEKKVIFKNCAPFTDCISKIGNTQVDNAKNIDVVMPMYNLIKYSDNYLKTPGSLWQYCRDKPAINNNGVIADFNECNVTNSFNFKVKIAGQTNDNGTKNY